MQSLKDQFAFFRQFRERFETTGAIAPSSGFLARSMTRFLANRNRKQPTRVLEIGPGTGPVTDRIVRLLGPGDEFDLVELNEIFVERLRERFQSDAAWKTVADISKVHQLPLQEFASDAPYDFVISGLPLNNFPADLVASIADAYFRLLKPGGTLSYFEYMYVRPIRKLVTRGDEQKRIVRIDDIMQGHCERHRIARDNIWMNIPPAWVQHLQTHPDAVLIPGASLRSGAEPSSDGR
ncbi:MAG: methyltransferase domain-containing protein [Planctomycetaceae bacterium]|nr:methyltransferase domain-containing protein [Planctomycetaceae bacterium]